MKIDLNKKYRTRDGKDVVIFSTEGSGTEPVIGQIKNDNNKYCSWTDEGRYHPDGDISELDLVEVKESEQTVTLTVDEALAAFNVSGNANDFLNACGFKMEQGREPRVLKCWVNFYNISNEIDSRAYLSKENADNWARAYKNRIGEAVEVTYEVEE